jgi:diacylglycerol kinase (ATP)
LAKFSIKARLKSIKDALTGIGHLIRGEHNAWIHLVATILVISLGAYFSVSPMEWIALVLAISIVWLAEGLNTAIEVLADAVSTEQNALIAQAKDVAAGAVLLAAFGAAVIGALVFYPYC